MRDLPTGPSLLALARDVLLGDLLPLLPEEARLDARLVANSMAIAERESIAPGELADDILGKLELFYHERPEGGAGEGDLLRRFSQDLRIGAFGGSPERDRKAREILWRLTVAKLRLANPRFLAANGFT
jgi:Domain of unknown function (DUF6285)